MDEESIMYLVFTLLFYIIAFSVIGSIGHGAVAILILVLLLLGVAVVLMLNWADFILFPIFTSVMGITFQPSANYKINKTQDAVIKEVNGLYYATGFITANLYAYVFKLETSEVVSDNDRIAAAPELWERALISISFPFKYHVFAAGLDVQQVRDELEGKRSYQEFQLSRAIQSNANEVTVTDIQRKISSLQAKIDRISAGEKPLASLMYIETSAIGISEKAATDALASQVRALQIALSGFDVDLTQVRGRELYTLFKFNFAVPTSFAEAAAYFDQQK
ncbi:MAG: hypothetical protein M1360_00910 [Candidatus Marsarchaeota archaeon]|jgi:hypothetical protein|nr:hypothetical protein [Candidatus Marsarchaeota archaeon]MCL5418486.1 hypothetical protein [Candidatus Marsarchaeota archaeon]